MFPFDAAFCFFLFFAFPGSDITAPKGVIESNEQNFRLLENVEERRAAGGEKRRDEARRAHFARGNQWQTAGAAQEAGEGRWDRLKAFKCSGICGVMLHPQRVDGVLFERERERESAFKGCIYGNN